MLKKKKVWEQAIVFWKESTDNVKTSDASH